MSKNWAPYVVQQGDHLTKLAFRVGAAPGEIWDHPSNRELARQRKTGHVLAPGDVIHLPQEPSKALALEHGTTNHYVARVPTVRVQIVLSDSGKPIANEPYLLEGLGEPVQGTTAGDGKVTFEAPVIVREVQLILYNRGVTYNVRVGDMDPLEDPSGVKKRLEHMGYFGWRAGSVGEPDVSEPERFARAVASFQTQHDLPVTGTVDEATRDAIKSAHES